MVKLTDFRAMGEAERAGMDPILVCTEVRYATAALLERRNRDRAGEDRFLHGGDLHQWAKTAIKPNERRWRMILAHPDDRPVLAVAKRARHLAIGSPFISGMPLDAWEEAVAQAWARADKLGYVWDLRLDALFCLIERHGTHPVPLLSWSDTDAERWALRARDKRFIQDVLRFNYAPVRARAIAIAAALPVSDWISALTRPAELLALLSNPDLPEPPRAYLPELILERAHQQFSGAHRGTAPAFSFSAPQPLSMVFRRPTLWTDVPTAALSYLGPARPPLARWAFTYFQDLLRTGDKYLDHFDLSTFFMYALEGFETLRDEDYALIARLLVSPNEEVRRRAMMCATKLPLRAAPTVAASEGLGVSV